MIKKSNSITLCNSSLIIELLDLNQGGKIETFSTDSKLHGAFAFLDKDLVALLPGDGDFVGAVGVFFEVLIEDGVEIFGLGHADDALFE